MAQVNQDAEIEQFRCFVQAESPSWILVSHGIAGAGKTALLGHLRKSLPTGWLPMPLDFRKKFLREDYESLVYALAEALRAGGLPREAWTAFQRRAEQVQQLKYVQIRMDMQVQESSGISSSMQDVRLDEGEALRALEAARELAHAWLDLADQVQARPIAFADHWEALLDGDRKELATWLFEDLLGKLHLWRPEFRLVIASDRPLRRDWLLRQRVRSEEVVEWEVKPSRHIGRLEKSRREEALMDISVLVEFFKQLGFLHLPAPVYGSYLVARVIVGLFKTMDFDLEQAGEVLVKLGVKVKDTLVPVLVEKAREGIESLAEWLRGQDEQVEVNEATAEILVSQT